MNNECNDYDFQDGDLTAVDLEDSNPVSFTVKDFDLADRPQEKALEHGCGVLAVPDLLALILRTGQPGMPITDICRKLMRSHDNSLHTLQRSSREMLMLHKGLGTVKALQIEAIMELIKRFNEETFRQRVTIRSSNDIYSIMSMKIGNLPHEEIWALFLSRNNQVIHRLRITSGSAIASVFDSKKVIREALLHYAEGVILCHNHPSGNLRPSPQDDKMTAGFKEACKCMDLRFLDHVIVTADGHYSYNDEGRL